MNRILLLGLLPIALAHAGLAHAGLAQVSGGAGAYANRSARYGNAGNPAEIERAKRQSTAAEAKDDNSTVIEAGILMIVRATPCEMHAKAARHISIRSTATVSML